MCIDGTKVIMFQVHSWNLSSRLCSFLKHYIFWSFSTTTSLFSSLLSWTKNQHCTTTQSSFFFFLLNKFRRSLGKFYSTKVIKLSSFFNNFSIVFQQKYLTKWQTKVVNFFWGSQCTLKILCGKLCFHYQWNCWKTQQHTFHYKQFTSSCFNKPFYIQWFLC